MTEVAEKTTPESPEGAAAEAASTEETKAAKTWLERFDTAVKNGKTNKRYKYFADFIARESTPVGEDGSPVEGAEAKYVLDPLHIALVMTQINNIRATEEYKAWDEAYRAETVGAGSKAVDLKTKTPEEIKAYQVKAEKQAKAAQERAARAMALLAELDAEASAEEAEESSDEADETVEDEEVSEEDQF